MRFIKEFGDAYHAARRVDTSGTWTLVSQGLVVTEDETVREQFVFKRAKGGATAPELMLLAHTVDYDPENSDLEETAGWLATVLNGDDQDILRRLRKVEEGDGA
jgi:hypothetical protein